MSMRFRTFEQVHPIPFTFDGEAMTALPGDTIAAALYAAGVRAWRRSRAGDNRGLFCGIGVCFDCLVTVNGLPDQRACQTLVFPGMVVETNLKG
jgi:predicted molibdopterin-dependent oxidoreductase YjgC